MERELTWEERINLLTEDQRRGKVPAKNGVFQGDYGNLSPFTDKIIHYFCDLHGVPRTLKFNINLNRVLHIYLVSKS